MTMNASAPSDIAAPSYALKPNPLSPFLTNNAWIVEQIAVLTDRPVDEVCRRLYEEEHQIGSNVNAAMQRFGVKPHEWSDDLIRFYQQTDAFLYELVAWNRNANKIEIRAWLGEVLARMPKVSLDVLTYGDGIGCDSLYLTQAGHRVTYCDLGSLSERFAQSLFAASGLPFESHRELEKLPAEAYDAIVCLDVLEHVPDPASLVAQLTRCLKPGGLLIASAPFFAVGSEFPTHLASNMRLSGSVRGLYGQAGLQLVDGRPFHDPLVLSKPPVVYAGGKGGFWRRLGVRAGGVVLMGARYWSWPHRRIGRILQRRGYRYCVDGLQPAAAETVV